MTVEEVIEVLRLITVRQSRGSITAAQAAEEFKDLMITAGGTMSNEELQELQDYALRLHHDLAVDLRFHHNYSVKGNDPQKPN